MKALFRVSHSFELSSRNYVIYAGTIVEGTIQPGMQLLIDLNNSTSVSCIIHAVEFIDSIPKRTSEVALCVRIENPEDRKFWLGLNVNNEVVHIVEA